MEPISDRMTNLFWQWRKLILDSESVVPMPYEWAWEISDHLGVPMLDEVDTP